MNSFGLIKSLLIIVFLFYSCSHAKNNPNEIGKKQILKEKNPVDTLVLRQGTFHRELMSNGRLEALQKAALRFQVAGELQDIRVANGQFVKKGQLLARLNDFSLKNELSKARNQLKQTEINFKDILIGQGYEPEDTASLSNEFMRIALVKSGLANARTDLREAQHRLKAASLYAPFSGVVANIEKKEFNRLAVSDDFCTLINNNHYHVKFSVLESELDEIALQKPIIATPLAGGEFRGTIDQINPVVDENGLVTVRGLVENSNGKLLEGMNVKVLVRTKFHNQLIIPKSALVLRQNKEVVFTVERDSTAIWNYVKTGQENSTSYTITEGLQPGDTLIVSGNINLAHESSVVIQ